MKKYIPLEIIVIYADIVSSTKIVSKLSEEKISEFYTLFSNEVSRVINDFGGSVYKYVGDEVIGIFPVPETGWIPTIDNSIKCIRYIREITKHSISPIAKSRGLPIIQCRIGADYGDAQIVNVGVKGVYLSAEILGHVMNIASKIQGKAEPGEVTIGENYREQLHTNYKLLCKKIEPLVINNVEYDVYHVDFNSMTF